MKLLASLRTVLIFVFRRQRAEREMEEELGLHLQNRADDLERQGLPRAEAERRARIEFGGYQRAKEECREALGTRWLGELIADGRYGLRQLRRNPGFTAVAIVTLALGIGANTAMFSVVNAVLWRGVPYKNPAQLVQVKSRSPQGEEMPVSAGDFTEWQQQTQSFQGLAAFKQWEFRTLTGAGEPDEVWVSPVSRNLFRLLGVNAAIGRTFVAGDTLAVILSHEYWRSRLAANPKILGSTLDLDGKPYTVVGIAPADFEFPAPNAQMWVPLAFNAADRSNHKDRRLSVIGRLKGGVTPARAQTEMEVVARRLGMQYPKTDAGWRDAVVPFKGREIGHLLRSAVLVLLASAAFVLLVVYANVAGLLLARGTARKGEMAIRAALGASRSRLIRQMVVESVMLAGAASAAGLLAASYGLHLVKSLVPKYSLIESQSLHQISINLPVLGFMVALSLVTGIAVALLPAFRHSSFTLNQTLQESGTAAGIAARGYFLQRALVVSEVALAMVLLVGAGLMIRSFNHLMAAPTGFNSHHLLTVRVPLVNYKYSQGPQSSAFYREVRERIRAIPGVEAVAMANNLPFTGFHTSLVFPAPPNSPAGPGHTIYMTDRSVSPGYFRTMGIPLKEGREFTAADCQKDARCVRIVNQTMARLYWPAEDAVGRLIHGACPKGVPGLIVGVAADSKQNSVYSQVEPEIYEPYDQHPWASFLVTFAVRTTSKPLDVAAAVRQAVWKIDHDQPVIQMRTMQNVVAESIWRQHFAALISGIFASIALVLAAVGIYGVLSYSISQRTHEIGIRAALGATRADILQMVMKEGLLFSMAGIGIGIGGALVLTRTISGLLYGVRAWDPLTFIALPLFLLGVNLFAVYIPARRATKVDPAVALRHE